MVFRQPIFHLNRDKKKEKQPASRPELREKKKEKQGGTSKDAPKVEQVLRNQPSCNLRYLYMECNKSKFVLIIR